MANINLLPWRETLREERKRKFLSIVVAAVLMCGAAVLTGDRLMRSAIDTQIARNDFLENEILVLEAQVEEISRLQEQKREIQDRMSVIQNLQGSRPVIVRVFDELVKTLPENVYFEEVKRSGDAMNIVGVAESYGQLTALMRKLDNSDWFAEPSLRIISAADGEGAFNDTGANRFSLNLTLASPESRDDGDFLELSE